jgi:predicted ATPase
MVEAETEKNPTFIQKLTPRNLLSFGPDFPGIELRPLNVLIGPNGSGKSNLVEVVNLLRNTPKEFREVLRETGGIYNWIWKRGQSSSVASAEASLVLPPLSYNPTIYTHRLAFRDDENSLLLLAEEIREENRVEGKGFHFENGKNAPRMKSWDSGWEELTRFNKQESVLKQFRDPVRHSQLADLTDKYRSIRIYKDAFFGRKNILRQSQASDARRDYLEDDFSNLGAFLNRIRSEHPSAKRKLVEYLQKLYDGITDFEVSTVGAGMQIFLHEGDFAIPATRLSDGTLRYLCLLAILCDPSPPPLICIEEPELGLHPDILPALGDLIKAASERTQIIITTHSDLLVSSFSESPEDVIVCEKHEGKTEMERLDAKQLEDWLKDYGLGEVWISGYLGGKRW